MVAPTGGVCHIRSPIRKKDRQRICPAPLAHQELQADVCLHVCVCLCVFVCVGVSARTRVFKSLYVCVYVRV